MTGAGVSAASGIPTFRGKGGLYDRLFEWEGQSYTPEEFITLAFYQQHPQPIWRWVEEIYSLTLSCKPNEMHTLIDTLACSLAARGKRVTLVTQNVDDLHLSPKGDKYKYYAIHGNVKFVRCNAFHLTPYQQFREEIKAGRKVFCPKCEGELRPHVLFFDESYGPLYGE